MVINVGRSDNSPTNPGHINYTFDDGEGHTFTIGVTSRGSLPLGHPYREESASIGGIGYEPNFPDGVLHFEEPMAAYQSAPIPLDPTQFAALVTFLDQHLGTNRTAANNSVFFVDYDLGRAGLDPITSPSGLSAIDTFLTIGAGSWPDEAFLARTPTEVWQQEGRDGLNCVELIFGWGGIPRIAPPDFDFAEAVNRTGFAGGSLS
jgi:hypothetical protein